MMWPNAPFTEDTYSASPPIRPIDIDMEWRKEDPILIHQARPVRYRIIQLDKMDSRDRRNEH